jgi:hypothetical protein
MLEAVESKKMVYVVDLSSADAA